MEEMEIKVKTIKEDFEELKAYQQGELNRLSQNINQKATRDDIDTSKAEILEQMHDLFKKMSTKFFTKDEINKKISSLSKKIKELNEHVYATENAKEDGMLTKKKLGPIECVSCEANLVNVQGIGAEYYANKKMPTKATNAMIGRYGAGFSKILSGLKEDLSHANLNHSVMNQNISDEIYQKRMERNASYDLETGHGYNTGSG